MAATGRAVLNFTRKWAPGVVRFSIIPILIFSQFWYLLWFFTHHDGCTGTSSAYYATMWICQGISFPILCVDSLLVNGIILFVWIAMHNEKHVNRFRIVAILYMLVFLFIAIDLLSNIQAI